MLDGDAWTAMIDPSQLSTALINLALLTGHVGRYGSGLNPLRGQNNVQGGGDMGAIPNRFVGFQQPLDPEVRARFEAHWGCRMPDKLGWTITDMFNAMERGDLRGLFVIGENPAQSEADQHRTRHLLEGLEHLVVQDIFLTETAWLADVVLPASAWPEKTGTVSNTDRTVQMGRQAVLPPGDAKPDLWIIQQIAQRMGLNWRYAGEHDGVAAVYEEMRQAMAPAIGGIDWARLNAGSVTYPCVSADDPGQPIVFHDQFPTPDGRVRLVPAGLIPAAEQPDADYPMVLITGRQLEHWHTGSMTRRASVLDALEPAATASLHAADMARLGLQPGQRIRVASRRGQVQVTVREDNGTPLGAVFMAFAYAEAAANALTNAALDPFGKIPEFKYCAVKVEPVAGDFSAR